MHVAYHPVHHTFESAGGRGASSARTWPSGTRTCLRAAGLVVALQVIGCRQSPCAPGDPQHSADFGDVHAAVLCEDDQLSANPSQIFLDSGPGTVAAGAGSGGSAEASTAAYAAPGGAGGAAGSGTGAIVTLRATSGSGTPRIRAALSVYECDLTGDQGAKSGPQGCAPTPYSRQSHTLRLVPEGTSCQSHGDTDLSCQTDLEGTARFSVAPTTPVPGIDRTTICVTSGCGGTRARVEVALPVVAPLDFALASIDAPAALPTTSAVTFCERETACQKIVRAGTAAVVRSTSPGAALGFPVTVMVTPTNAVDGAVTTGTLGLSTDPGCASPQPELKVGVDQTPFYLCPDHEGGTFEVVALVVGREPKDLPITVAPDPVVVSARVEPVDTSSSGGASGANVTVSTSSCSGSPLPGVLPPDVQIVVTSEVESKSLDPGSGSTVLQGAPSSINYFLSSQPDLRCSASEVHGS